MNLMSRMLSGLFALTALMLTVSSLPAESLLELFPMTDRFGRRMSLVETQRQGEQLSRLTQGVMERLCCKERISDALTSGEMPLIEAAACYRSLYEDSKAWHNFQRPCPKHDDGENWCREVILWTDMKIRIEQSPDKADALRQCLEAELQELLECHSTVGLPE
ncbi:MAG TPA: hypothetical protein VMF69_00710 [Gemmataceae bacterium]|nr:hypothetical protein [Gemmataceae bacterium]